MTSGVEQKPTAVLVFCPIQTPALRMARPVIRALMHLELVEAPEHILRECL